MNDSFFKFVFGIIILSIVGSIILNIAAYDECKKEGNKGCLNKVIENNRRNTVIIRDNDNF